LIIRDVKSVWRLEKEWVWNDDSFDDEGYGYDYDYD
jgi:hypothetical protein